MRAVPLELLYLHGPSRIDAEVLAHAGIVHRRLDAAPIVGTSPFRLAGNVLRLLRASGQAWREMGAFRPHAVLATGGYVSAPAMLAARLRGSRWCSTCRTPSPGWRCAPSPPWPGASPSPSPSPCATSSPARPSSPGIPCAPSSCRPTGPRGGALFDLADDLPVVMVMGGSTGAHSLNLTVSDALEPLLHHAQVIHLCGVQDEQLLRQQRGGLDPALRQRYRLFRYLHQGVPEAMAASDLIVCRAGASALAELPLLRLPAVLVPHPYGHQDANAAFLVEHGGAVSLPDAALGQGDLLGLVLDLLEDDKRRAEMAEAMGRLARPQAADNIAALVLAVARRKRGTS